MHFQHKKCHLCGFKSCVCIKIITFSDNLRQPRQRKLDKEEFSSSSSLFNDPLSNCSQGLVTLPGKRKQVYTAWIGTHPNSLSPITRQTIRQQMHRFFMPNTFSFPRKLSAEGTKAAPAPSLPLQDPGCRQGEQENPSRGCDTSTNCLNGKLFQPGDFKIITNILYFF